MYIHKQSNHPNHIIEKLPEMINRRISEISCNESDFNKAKSVYEAALKKSSFTDEMKFKTMKK